MNSSCDKLRLRGCQVTEFTVQVVHVSMGTPCFFVLLVETPRPPRYELSSIGSLATFTAWCQRQMGWA